MSFALFRAAMLGAPVVVMPAVLMPSPALAHAALVKSVPGSRSVLSLMPPELELCFNEEVELKFSSVQLSPVGGRPIPLEPLRPGRSPECVRAQSPSMSPGRYELRYNILSRDGHVVKYGLQFTITGAQP